MSLELCLSLPGDIIYMHSLLLYFFFLFQDSSLGEEILLLLF